MNSTAKSRNWLAWMQLARLSALPTAVSNVMLGYLLAMQSTGGEFHLVELILLILASASMYTAGMILNDVFGIETDRLKRPERPLPSGRISVRTAHIVGFSLLLIGPMLAAIAGWIIGPNQLMQAMKPVAVAGLLLVAIVAYDRWLQWSLIAPLVMGICRTLNLLLGASTFPVMNGSVSELFNFPPIVWWLSLALGIYVTGITLFAKHEASSNGNVFSLVAGAAIAMAGIAAMMFVNTLFPFSPAQNQNLAAMFPMLMGLVALPVVRRMVVAIANRTPRNIQTGVVTALRSIIVFDATLCFLAAPHLSGYALCVVALLIPTLFAGRWIRST